MWLFGLTFVLFFYTSLMINFMLLPGKQKTPETWEELLQSNYKLMIEGDSFVMPTLEVKIM